MLSSSSSFLSQLRLTLVSLFLFGVMALVLVVALNMNFKDRHFLPGLMQTAFIQRLTHFKPFDWMKPIEPVQVAALTPGQHEVVQYLAKRYRVSAEAVTSIVQLAFEIGNQENVPPSLILAIVGIESSFNPFAASPVGAKGLMQVMAHVHKDRFEALAPGEWSALNPETNMRVGAQIIGEYTRRTGSVQQGLRWYVGAAVHGKDGGYVAKVLSMQSKIEDAFKRGNQVLVENTARDRLLQAYARAKNT